MHGKVSFLSLFIKGSSDTRTNPQYSATRRTACGPPGPPYCAPHLSAQVVTEGERAATRQQTSPPRHLQSSRRDTTAALAGVFVARRALKTSQDESVLPAVLPPAGMCIYPGTPRSSGGLQDMDLSESWGTAKASDSNERGGWRPEWLIIHGATHWMAPP